MDKRAKEIYEKFDGKLVGSYKMKRYVCKTLSGMPQAIIHFITKNCWFMGSMEDAWAFTFTGRDLKNHHLVFISDDLLAQNENQIQQSIAHEIGHVILKHRNSVFIKQSQAEIKKQEKEADAFAEAMRK